MFFDIPGVRIDVFALCAFIMVSNQIESRTNVVR